MNFRSTVTRPSGTITQRSTPAGVGYGQSEHCLLVHSVGAIRPTRSHPAVVAIRGTRDRVVAVINLGAPGDIVRQ